MSHISNIIKEPWATPNRATPKNCYPFKKKLNNSQKKSKNKKNPTNQSNNSKRNSKPQNKNIQKNKDNEKKKNIPKKQLKEHQKVSKQFKTKNKKKQVQKTQLKKTKFQQIRRLVEEPQQFEVLAAREGCNQRQRIEVRSRRTSAICTSTSVFCAWPVVGSGQPKHSCRLQVGNEGLSANCGASHSHMA